MLSIGKLGTGQVSYYVEAVAGGADEYYAEHGEVTGRWIGDGAALLNLAGTVDRDDFRAVLSGVDPSTGKELARANRRVPAFDVTLSPPKSVSVLWALADPPVAQAIIDAHETAVDATIRYLEREAIRSRRGHDGIERLDGAGMVAAAFRHYTSRAGDPQLHTHVVVANTTRCDDGAWRTLDARLLYRHGQTAGYLYKAALRAGLTERLSITWEAVVKGAAEITGVPTPVIAEFSRRRADIAAALAASGHSSARAAEIATLATRPTKDHTADVATLTGDWTARAAALGFDRDGVARLLRPHRASQHARSQAVMDDEQAARQLTEQSSTFDRRDVLRQLASQARNGATIEQLEREADRFLLGDHAVPVGVSLVGLTYTSPELIAVEQRLADLADTPEGDHVGVCRHAAETLARYPDLTGEQRTMVERLTTGGEGITVVVGAAGSGKTYALRAARDAWTAEDYTVIGCAVAARAADELERSARIPSCTLTRLLADVDDPNGPGLGWRAVVVVDEAGMVGTRQLLQLAECGLHWGAKLVLVGDHHQLPEIAVGGAFAALAERLDAIELTDNRRQRDPVERAALAELRDGDPAVGLDLLAEHAHVTQHPDRVKATERLVDDWADAALDGDDALMLALHHRDVVTLNHLARARFHAGGALEPDALHAAGRDYAIGDWIITTRNDYRHDLLNGQRGAIIAIDPGGRRLLVDFEGRGRVVVPADYVDAGHVDHAYAITVHKAQGLTCDRAFVLGGEHLYREAGYTALSRGRHENRLYAVEPERDPEAHIEHDDQSAYLTVRTALHRSRRQLTAVLESLPPAEPSAWDRTPIVTHDLADGIEMSL
jgi:conjugative relaxase-like TrwC/TraI family protein